MSIYFAGIIADGLWSTDGCLGSSTTTGFIGAGTFTIWNVLGAGTLTGVGAYCFTGTGAGDSLTTGLTGAAGADYLTGDLTSLLGIGVGTGIEAGLVVSALMGYLVAAS